MMCKTIEAGGQGALRSGRQGLPRLRPAGAILRVRDRGRSGTVDTPQGAAGGHHRSGTRQLALLSSRRELAAQGGACRRQAGPRSRRAIDRLSAPECRAFGDPEPQTARTGSMTTFFAMVARGRTAWNHDRILLDGDVFLVAGATASLRSHIDCSFAWPARALSIRRRPSRGGVDRNTTSCGRMQIASLVAPRAGAWIETPATSSSEPARKSPLARGWILNAKCNALHRLASSANSSAKKRSRFEIPSFHRTLSGKQVGLAEEGISSRVQ